MKTARRRRSLSAAQRRIQEAAVRLFAEQGSTQVTMSELAQAAGVARGTVHNNLESTDAFFRQLANDLATEMYDRITASCEGVTDPAQRLGLGVRFYVRRAHEDPHWGRFLLRFAMSEPSMQSLWLGQPTQDLVDGHKSGKYDFRLDQLPSAVSLMASATLGAIRLVLEGHRTWRDAGSDAVEFCLKSLGVPREEARKLATLELPALREASPSPPRVGRPSPGTTRRKRGE
ncbi:TetR/AcrR family transcriptional regulator [Myxococcus qinghaiensis]|uniref:TetR/AcrR family transcriptional regulator n=1 Tax=Myxococcus qinghaiensis TaxID=2906758 RepID=UPI0020A7D67D|nr:TetR/AcrR family transcriptional regulator [Myxococcus qinghaiensis]MCP3162414.1 TetR/AcrR family transcriptional regulator [Myxococcus qinghaiensis]